MQQQAQCQDICASDIHCIMNAVLFMTLYLYGAHAPLSLGTWVSARKLDRLLRRSCWYSLGTKHRLDQAAQDPSTPPSPFQQDLTPPGVSPRGIERCRVSLDPEPSGPAVTWRRGQACPADRRWRRGRPRCRRTAAGLRPGRQPLWRGSPATGAAPRSSAPAQRPGAVDTGMSPTGAPGSAASEPGARQCQAQGQIRTSVRASVSVRVRCDQSVASEPKRLA